MDAGLAGTTGKRRVSRGTGVSFLVTAHNAQSTLAATIAALQSQMLNVPFEVVVVDDRSSDDTRAIVERLAERDDRIRIVHLSNLPAGITSRQAALDVAVRAARGGLLLVVDADATPAPEWATRMVDALARADLVASALDFRPAPGVGGWGLARLQTVDAAHYLSFCDLLGMAGLASGVCFGACGFRRSLYESVGGFGGLGFTLVEDLAFARAARRRGARVRVLWGTPVTVSAVGHIGALVERVRRVSATGGPSFLAATLGGWGLSLALLGLAALGGVVPVVWFAARYGVGVLWTAAQTIRAGSWRALPVVPVYELLTIAVALTVVFTPSRSRHVQWGGVQYVRQRGTWTRVESIPVQ